jgi:hypothetical protein
MAMIDIKINPSKKDLVVFAFLWVGFFALLAWLSLQKPTALLIAAVVTGTAFLISISFNKDQPRKAQLTGMTIPLVLLAIGGAERFLGVDPWTVVWVLVGVGAAGGVAMLASSSLAKSIYVKWMYAALPLGWTFSHLVLGMVFFLVMTPISLILRVLGNDPMERAYDKSAATYWKPHQQAKDPARYFRQF